MRLKFRSAFFLLVLFGSINVFAQDAKGEVQERTCGTMENLERLLLADPSLQDRMDKIEYYTQQYILEQSLQKPNESGQEKALPPIYTIPVVYHIVYNNAAENLSDAEIQSQMDVLNEDFRRLNADADNAWPQAADSEIEFCLATIDPNGNPTNGIVRVATSQTSFSTNDAMKFDSQGGSSAWPAADYMNIWSCDLSGGLLGYAQFPGGPASTDGIVNDYLYTGRIGAQSPFELGRTGTHEAGHYFNLRHIWGDGNCNQDDLVADTPTSDGSHSGCPIGDTSCGTTDMVQNYMDYSHDACMNLFTQGQATRMRALLAPGGARSSLINNGKCGPPPAPTCSDGIQNQGELGIDCDGPCSTACPTCTDGIQNQDETGVDCGGASCAFCPCNGSNVRLVLTLDNFPQETDWILTTSTGATFASSGGTYAGTPDGTTITVDWCLPNDCYDFTINDSFGDGICCGFGLGSYDITNLDDGTLLANGGDFDDTETMNFCVAQVVASVSLESEVKMGGCFDNSSSLMSDDLRVQGLIPNQEPYTDLTGFTHVGGGGGETVSNAVLAIGGSNAIVDWVFLELRDKNNNSIVMDTRAALLQRDGDIVDTDGFSTVSFAMPADDYYVAVRHRNHLGVMTANTVSFAGGNNTGFDFSNPAIGLWGNNAMRVLGSVNTMWPGNGNGNTATIYQGSGSDITPITSTVFSDPSNTNFQLSFPVQGYYAADYNMDGEVIYQGSGSDILVITQSVFTNPANVNFQLTFPIIQQLP